MHYTLCCFTLASQRRFKRAGVDGIRWGRVLHSLCLLVDLGVFSWAREFLIHIVFIIRLGIMKEMEPMYVATYSEKPAVLDGHPFVVEAGVSLGGAEASDPLQFDGLTLYALHIFMCGLRSWSVFSPLSALPSLHFCNSILKRSAESVYDLDFFQCEADVRPTTLLYDKRTIFVALALPTNHFR